MSRFVLHMFLLFSTLMVALLGILVSLAIPLSQLRFVNPQWTMMMALNGDFSPEQIWVPLSKISKHLQQTVIAAEDGRFYEHEGVDWDEMRKSLEKDLKKRKFLRGSSTITMQLMKNLYLPKRKFLLRKALEVGLALGVEKILSKERLLEIYLNVIEWGPGVYGVESASQHYFKKSAAHLSHEEALFLAAIIPNPSKWGSRPPSRYVKKRESLIAARLGLITSRKKLAIAREGIATKPRVPFPPAVDSPEPVSPSPVPSAGPVDVDTDEESDSLPPEPSEATTDTPTDSQPPETDPGIPKSL